MIPLQPKSQKIFDSHNKSLPNGYSYRTKEKSAESFFQSKAHIYLFGPVTGYAAEKE